MFFVLQLQITKSGCFLHQRSTVRIPASTYYEYLFVLVLKRKQRGRLFPVEIDKLNLAKIHENTHGDSENIGNTSLM